MADEYRGPHTFWEKATGRVYMTVPGGPPNYGMATKHGFNVYEGDCLDGTLYYMDKVTKEPMLRPEPIEPGTMPNGLDLSEFPPETEVIVYWNEQEIDRFKVEGDGLISLVDKGSYRIVATPPFPDHPVTSFVEVV